MSSDDSWLSWRSRGCVLSICSEGSILSVGSVGSIAGLGCIGSVASVGSTGSLMSHFSAGSIQSGGSVLSAQATRSIGSYRADDGWWTSYADGDLPRWLAPATAVTVGCVAAAAWRWAATSLPTRQRSGPGR